MILALPVSILTQNFTDHDEINYDDEQLTASTPNQKPIDDNNTSVQSVKEAYGKTL